jgi:hypothetical protein
VLLTLKTSGLVLLSSCINAKILLLHSRIMLVIIALSCCTTYAEHLGLELLSSCLSVNILLAITAQSCCTTYAEHLRPGAAQQLRECRQVCQRLRALLAQYCEDLSHHRQQLLGAKLAHCCANVSVAAE